MEKVKKENSAGNKVPYVVRPSVVERKKKIMEMIKKAGSEEYETEWDEKGAPVSKKNLMLRKENYLGDKGRGLS